MTLHGHPHYDRPVNQEFNLARDDGLPVFLVGTDANVLTPANLVDPLVCPVGPGPVGARLEDGLLRVLKRFADTCRQLDSHDVPSFCPSRAMKLDIGVGIPIGALCTRGWIPKSTQMTRLIRWVLSGIDGYVLNSTELI